MKFLKIFRTYIYFLIFFVGLFFSATNINASTFKWYLSTDGEWETYTNWKYQTLLGEWNTPGGDYPDSDDDVEISGDNEITIKLTSDITIRNLTIGKSDDKKITIDLNGHTLSCDSIFLHNDIASDNKNANFAVIGNGKIETNKFDFPNKGTAVYSVNIGSDSEFYIKDNFFVNTEPGANVKTTFSGSGQLYIPKCGANVDWGESCVDYTGLSNPVKTTGSANYYSVTSDEATKKFTLTRSTASGGQAVKYPYKAKIITSSGTTFDYDASNAFEETGFVTIPTASTSTTFTITPSATFSAGDALRVRFYAPDGSGLLLGVVTIQYTECTWIGEKDSNWNESLNWLSGAIPSATDNVSIPTVSAGCFYPKIDTSVSAKSLSVERNAELTVLSSGTLSVSEEFVIEGSVDIEGNTTAGQMTNDGILSVDSCTLKINNGDFISNERISLSNSIVESTGEQIYKKEVDFSGNNSVTLKTTSSTSKITFNDDLKNVSGSPKVIFESNVNTTKDITIECPVKFTNTQTITTDGKITFNDNVSLTTGELTFKETGWTSSSDTVSNSSIEFQKNVEVETLTANMPVNMTSTANITSSNEARFIYGLKASSYLNLVSTKKAIIYKSNTISEVKIDNSTLGAESIVIFESEETQTINKFSLLKGSSASNRLILKSDLTTEDVSKPWICNVSDIDSSNIEFVTVQYSKSENPLALTSSESGIKEGVLSTTENWFSYKYYWIGGTDTDWENGRNWSTTATSPYSLLNTTEYPDYENGVSNITIVKSDTNILTLTKNIKIKSLYVRNETTVDFSNKNVTAEKIYSAGRIRIDGSQTTTVNTSTSPSAPAVSCTETEFESKATGYFRYNATSTIEYYELLSSGIFTTLSWGRNYQNVEFSNGFQLNYSGNLSVNKKIYIFNGDSNQFSLTGTIFIYSNEVYLTNPKTTASASEKKAGDVILQSPNEIKILGDSSGEVECTTLNIKTPAILPKKITTTGGSATTGQVYEDSISLSDNTILEGATGSFIEFKKQVTTDSHSLEVIADNAKFSLGFSDSADLTLQGNAEIYGDNTFSKLSIDNSTLSSSSTVNFEGGKTQTITTFGDLKGKDKDNRLTLDSTDGTNWNVTTTNTAFSGTISFVSVSNSDSATELKITPSIPRINEGTASSTTKWFSYKYYWIGGTDTNWKNGENWSTTEASPYSLLDSTEFPDYTNGIAEIVILDSMTKPLKLSNDVSIKNLLVGQTDSSNANIDLVDYKITCTDTDSTTRLSNNGILTFSGNGRIYDNSSTLIMDSEKGTVEYNGSSGTITNYGGTDNSIFDYYNLVIKNGTWNIASNIKAKNDFIIKTDGILNLQNTAEVNSKLENNGKITSEASKYYFWADVENNGEINIEGTLWIENDCKNIINNGLWKTSASGNIKTNLTNAFTFDSSTSTESSSTYNFDLTSSNSKLVTIKGSSTNLMKISKFIDATSENTELQYVEFLDDTTLNSKITSTIGKIVLDKDKTITVKNTFSVENLEMTGGTLINNSSSPISVTNLTLNSDLGTATTNNLSGGTSLTSAITISNIKADSNNITTTGFVVLKESAVSDSIGKLFISSDKTTLSNDILISELEISNGATLNGTSGKIISISKSWIDNNSSSGFLANGSIVKVYSSTTESSILIKGKTTFDKFSAINLGGKTLEFDGNFLISSTDTDSLILSGANPSSLLTIDGTGSITIQQTEDNGEYLLVMPNITIGTSPSTIVYTAYNSIPDSTIPFGWDFMLEYYWTGKTSDAWTTASNWAQKNRTGTYSESNTYPPFAGGVLDGKCSVFIQQTNVLGGTVSTWPKLSGNINLQSLNVTSSTTGSNPISNDANLYLESYALTVTKEFKNSGNIHLNETQLNVVAPATPTIVMPDTTVTGNIAEENGTWYFSGGNVKPIANLSYGSGTSAKNYRNIVVNGNAKIETLIADKLILTTNLSGDGIKLRVNNGTTITASVILDTPSSVFTTFDLRNNLGISGTVKGLDASRNGSLKVTGVNDFIRFGNGLGTDTLPIGDFVNESTGETRFQAKAYANSISITGKTILGTGGIKCELLQATTTIELKGDVVNKYSGFELKTGTGYSITLGKTGSATAQSITSKGKQTYTTDNVVLESDVVVTANDGTDNKTVTFTKDISGGKNLELNANAKFINSSEITLGKVDFNGNSVVANSDIKFTLTDTATFSNNTAFTQNNTTTTNFEISNGNVNVGVNKFISGKLIIGSTAKFTQTGKNVDISDVPLLQSVYGIENNGSCLWDSNGNTGTVTLNNAISGTNASEVVFNKKDVTINFNNNDLSGVFYSLTIPTGKTVKNGSGLWVRKNLTVKGTYQHNNQTLTLGGVNVNGKTYTSDSNEGIISDFSSTNFGTVVVNGLGNTSKAIKTFETDFTADSVRFDTISPIAKLNFGKNDTDSVEFKSASDVSIPCPVELLSNTTLLITGGTKSITFESTLDSTASTNKNLFVGNSTNEVNIEFKNNVGATTSLGDIEIFGNANFSGTSQSINSTLRQKYHSSASSIDTTLSSTNGIFIYLTSDKSWTGKFTFKNDLGIFGAKYNCDDPRYSGSDTRFEMYDYGSYTPSGSSSKLTGGFFTNETNLYINGADLSNITFNIPDNSASNPVFNATSSVTEKQWGIPYAVAFNSSISNVTINGSYLAASKIAQNCIDGTGNTNIQFEIPQIKKAYSVYDDVICIEFNMPIENSNDEIRQNITNLSSSALKNGGLWYNNKNLNLGENVYSNPDCTTLLSATEDVIGSGTENPKIYIKTQNEKWNTDANGTYSFCKLATDDPSITDKSESTDRNGVHHSIKIDLSMIEGTFTAANGHTMCKNYGIGFEIDNSDSTLKDAPIYTETEDYCSPVLIAVRTGQEIHQSGSTQEFYDAHNFIEFTYSEEVNIGDLAENCVNKQAQTTFSSATEHGGAIVNKAGDGIDILGFASISNGSVKAGFKTLSSNKWIGTQDTSKPHALYRLFSDEIGLAKTNHPYKVRVSVAGYVDETNKIDGFNNWVGYIESATMLSGTFSALPNSFITDKAIKTPIAPATTATPNSIDTISTINHPLNSTLNNGIVPNSKTLYGQWDISAPVFAPFVDNKITLFTNPDTPDTVYEIIGMTNSRGDTYLTNVEFHILDNAKERYLSEGYSWTSRIGWQNAGNTIKTPEKNGGSRVFTNNENKTQGGIRYSSLNKSTEAFTYKTKVGSNISEETNFATTEMDYKVFSNLYYQEGDTITKTYQDEPYVRLYLNDSDIAKNLPLRTQFTIYYEAGDENNPKSFITDLAGNRLVMHDEGSNRKTLQSVDVSPPGFSLSLAPLGHNKIYVVFSKKLYFAGKDFEELKQTGNLQNALNTIKDNFKINGFRITNLEYKDSNDDHTSLLITLDKNVSLPDIINNAYIELDNSSVYGVSGKESYIKDSIGNYLENGTKHTISDFAVNAIKPLFAYTQKKDNETEEDWFSTQGVYGTDVFDPKTKDYAVHDFTPQGGNYNRLRAGRDIVLQASCENYGNSLQLVSDIKANLKPSCISTNINKQLGVNWRIWLPELLTSIAYDFNSNDTHPINAVSAESKNLWNFTIPNEDSNPNSRKWKGNNEVQFLFRIGNTKIDHEGDATTFSDLYALRIPEENVLRDDYSFLDLWSFSLNDIKKQRGGVTILNNVINATVKEQTVIEVDMASDGLLNVFIMTLDGNIIKRLSKGQKKAGTHYFKWDGTNNAGKTVARGLYFVRVSGKDIDETRKVMVVKD